MRIADQFSDLGAFISECAGGLRSQAVPAIAAMTQGKKAKEGGQCIKVRDADIRAER
jgi:hypothetical protein